jgi:uncharacterized membrane protein HdeD (DUF308 family)
VRGKKLRFNPKFERAFFMTATARLSGDIPATVLARMWWPVMLKALAVTAFAILAFFWLGKSLGPLTTLFAVYAGIDGILAIVGAILGGGLAARGGLALAGLASLAASAAAAILPDITWPNLVTIVGVWALVRGGLEFVSALTLRRFMERDWSLALIGMLSMLFGAMLVLQSGFDPWTFVRLLSAYALILGLLQALLAFRFLRGLRP